MHLGGNRRWVPLSFENNNKNRYRGNKFFITISSIQLYSRGQSFSFSLKVENPRPPSPLWTTYCGVRRSSGKNCLLINPSK